MNFNYRRDCAGVSTVFAGLFVRTPPIYRASLAGVRINATLYQALYFRFPAV